MATKCVCFCNYLQSIVLRLPPHPTPFFPPRIMLHAVPVQHRICQSQIEFLGKSHGHEWTNKLYFMHC